MTKQDKAAKGLYVVVRLWQSECDEKARLPGEVGPLEARAKRDELLGSPHKKAPAAWTKRTSIGKSKE